VPELTLSHEDKIYTVEDNVTAYDLGRRREQAGDAEEQGRFATPGFSYQPQKFSLSYRQTHAVAGPHRVASAAVLNDEVAYLKNGRHVAHAFA
jgi:hypothetical protein